MVVDVVEVEVDVVDTEDELVVEEVVLNEEVEVDE